MLDSLEGVCAGQAGSEFPATSVPFSNYADLDRSDDRNRIVLAADTPRRPGPTAKPRTRPARPPGAGARPLKPSVAPGAHRPAGGSPRLGSGGGHQGSSGTAVCLPWPSGTRSWATRARCRPPPRPAGRGEGRVRPCRWVGLPRRIPFVQRIRLLCRVRIGAVLVRTPRQGQGRGDAGGHPAERRMNRTIMQTDPTARHSPIGSFQRVCYLARATALIGPTLASS
jgi:hypothetical protein